jgi:hypothetical protein
VDTYSLDIEKFTIHHTRALDEDTLWLNMSTFVDGVLANSWSLRLGEFDDGVHPVAHAVRARPGTVINDPDAKVVLNFQLVNSGDGNVDPDALSGRLAATADQMAGIVAGIATLTGHLEIAIGLEIGANLWTWLDTDCDGPIAAGQIDGPRYLLDFQTDNLAHSVRTIKNYPGQNSPTGCGGNSNYDLVWWLHHDRTWLPVVDSGDPPTQMVSVAGAGAAAHNGMLHVFGIDPVTTNVNHGASLTGGDWRVDGVGFSEYALKHLCAVSFNDRLQVFGVAEDQTVVAESYTVDGASWFKEDSQPPAFHTNQAIATVEFLDRLRVFARDQATGKLRVTSTDDVRVWLQWADVTAAGLVPQSAVAGAVLNGTLHLFGIYDTGKKPAHVVVHTSTQDGHTWAAWDMVEAGLPPLDAPAGVPLDVAAGTFDGRVYVATRWQTTSGPQQQTTTLDLNFSGDGENWSGWRAPESYESDFTPTGTVALAAVHNHLYIASPRLMPDGDTTQIWAY